MNEHLRRLVLFLFGSLLFEAPGLRQLKIAIYRRAFHTGIGCNIQYGTKFILIHPNHDINQNLRIGNNVAIGSNSFLDYSGGLEIGDDSWLSLNVTIFTHTHHVEKKALKVTQPVSFHPLKIGKDCWLATNVTILPSTGVIGDGAIIGAGSVVTKPIDPYTIVAGNPAQVIGTRTD